MKEGIAQQKHLSKIAPDQSILGIGQLDATVKDQPDRPWWASQVIVPTVGIADYDQSTGRYVLKGGLQTIINDATSAAAYTLTCPAGHKYIVRFVSARDNTSAVQWIMEHYDTDGVTVAETIMGAAVVPAGNIQIMCGSPVWVDTNAVMHPAIGKEIILTPLQTLVTTAIGFVAADDMLIVMVYEDVVLE